MIDRIFTGWTFTRLLYVSIGSFIIVQFMIEKQWMGALLGGYFAAMGLFGFGCAGGNCVSPKRDSAPAQKPEPNINVGVEEVK